MNRAFQIAGIWVFVCVRDTEPCDMDCPNGFRKDLTGKIEVCECSDVSTSTLSLLSSTVPSTVAGVQSNKELNANLLVPCVPLMGCIKQCLYGYRTDKQGCQRCKCNKCPAFDCAKKCQHGFVHSADGCKLCKCLGEFTCGRSKLFRLCFTTYSTFHITPLITIVVTSIFHARLDNCLPLASCYQ